MPTDKRGVTLILPSLGAGGAEKVAVFVASTLAVDAWRVRLITIAGQEADFYALPTDIRRTALGRMGNSVGLAGAITANIGRVHALRRTILTDTTHLAIAFLPATNVLSLLALAGTGVPVIVTEHVHPADDAIGCAWSTLRRITYPFARRVISVGAGVDAAFSWLPAARRGIVPNPVLLDPKPVPGDPTLTPADAPQILAMGRLTRQKGFDLLIRAFGRIATAHPAWHLTILGEGEERASLSALAATEGVAQRVHLPGRVAAPAPILSRGTIFAFPSRFEGFGMALAEAMACGLPVVAADCLTGPAELLCGGAHGVLVPVEDVPRLAVALDQLMRDPAMRLQLAEVARLGVARFAPKRIESMWRAIATKEARQ